MRKTTFITLSMAITGSLGVAALVALERRAAVADDQGAPPPVKRGYAPVNGLKMYYEVHGKAAPLVLIHGGGSTIETSFGKVLKTLAESRQVIAFEQQGHGRTGDVDRPFSFEQSADDTAALLRYLGVEKADLYGYSNGGNIAMQVAIRHPKLVRKLIIAAAMYRNDGLVPQLRTSLEHASPDSMPANLREAYLRASPNPEKLASFVDKSVKRMLGFKDWRPEVVCSIKAPAMVLIGDADVVRPEHAVEMFRLLPHGQLAVLPGTDHMTLTESADLLIPMIRTFLDSPMPKAPEGNTP